MAEAVKSAIRVIEIMEYFARYREPARMSQIADALGYPTSSANALLKSMVARNYMDFDALTHRYMPSARMAHLTSWIDGGGFEQGVMLDAMCRLRDAVDEPVLLATPAGLFVDYIETVHVADGEHLRIRTGTRRLLVQTGIGWLYLSRQSRADALDIYRRTILAGELSERQFSRTAFERRLDEHRDLDVSVLCASALKIPTCHWNGGMISALVPAPQGHRALALGVYGAMPSMRTKRALIVAELRRILAEIREEVATGEEALAGEGQGGGEAADLGSDPHGRVRHADPAPTG